MLRKVAWICLWISFCILFVFSMSSAAKPVPTSGFSIYVNGAHLKTETPPVIKNDLTFVPVRAISEALDAQVDWDENTGHIFIKNDAHELHLTVGKHTATQNGQQVTLEAAPFIYGHHVMVPLRWIGEALNMNVSWFSATKTIWLQEEGTHLAHLPVVGDEAQLKKLFNPFVKQLKERSHYSAMETTNVATSAQADQASSGSASRGSSAGESTAGGAGTASTDHSTTNVQVEGVDEADIVKTDGEYIFQVNGNRIFVIKANPVEQMEVVSTLNLETESFQPMEMYLDDEHLVVIGYRYVPYADDRLIPKGKPRAEIMPIPARIGVNTISALVYDRTDPRQLVPIRELELEGHYLSSRKIGSALYIVSNQYVPIQPLAENKDIKEIIPHYYDSAVHEQFETIDLQKMVYHPNYIDTNVLLVAAVDLNDNDRKMEVTSFLGGGQTIYASHEHLYVAVTDYERIMPIAEPAIGVGENRASSASSVRAIMPIAPQKQKTNIFRFALQNGSVTFDGEGSVPGRILNQFSMDEHDGHFRIATTTGDMWASGEFTSKNHLYVLDNDLEIVGSIEDLAPGERIYSVRFMGDRGYIVTFRTVDPLFVIDLESPTDPELLGELKIPGYSDYLHPYDENHLIGIGKEVIVVDHKDEKGKVINTVAYDQGMKLSLFDITDVHNPVEKFTETIGGRGTHSDVLYNHKSLLFSKEKQLLALPITVMEVDGSPVDHNGFPRYGTFAFQGAYVYDIDIEQGFRLKGKITHLTEQEIAKAGQYGYGSESDVQRIITIGDTLYTLSLNHVKAHDLGQMKEQNHIQLQ